MFQYSRDPGAEVQFIEYILLMLLVVWKRIKRLNRRAEYSLYGPLNKIKLTYLQQLRTGSLRTKAMRNFRLQSLRNLDLAHEKEFNFVPRKH